MDEPRYFETRELQRHIPDDLNPQVIQNVAFTLMTEVAISTEMLGHITRLYLTQTTVTAR
jgi:hypothetical protein